MTSRYSLFIKKVKVMFPGRPGTSDQKEKKKEITVNDLQFIFVHRLSGWGSYDEAYWKMPYWGMRG